MVAFWSVVVLKALRDETVGSSNPHDTIIVLLQVMDFCQV